MFEFRSLLWHLCDFITVHFFHVSMSNWSIQRTNQWPFVLSKYVVLQFLWYLYSVWRPLYGLQQFIEVLRLKATRVILRIMLEILIISLCFNFILLVNFPFDHLIPAVCLDLASIILTLSSLPSDCFPVQPFLLSVNQNKQFKISFFKFL